MSALCRISVNSSSSCPTPFLLSSSYMLIDELSNPMESMSKRTSVFNAVFLTFSTAVRFESLSWCFPSSCCFARINLSLLIMNSFLRASCSAWIYSSLVASDSRYPASSNGINNGDRLPSLYYASLSLWLIVIYSSPLKWCSVLFAVIPFIVLFILSAVKGV